MLALMVGAWHFTVIFTVEKRALLLARGMDSVCGAATPAHQSSTIAAAPNYILHGRQRLSRLARYLLMRRPARFLFGCAHIKDSPLIERSSKAGVRVGYLYRF